MIKQILISWGGKVISILLIAALLVFAASRLGLFSLSCSGNDGDGPRQEPGSSPPFWTGMELPDFSSIWNSIEWPDTAAVHVYGDTIPDSSTGEVVQVTQSADEGEIEVVIDDTTTVLFEHDVPPYGEVTGYWEDGRLRVAQPRISWAPELMGGASTQGLGGAIETFYFPSVLGVKHLHAPNLHVEYPAWREDGRPAIFGVGVAKDISPSHTPLKAYIYYGIDTSGEWRGGIGLGVGLLR